MFSAIGRSVAKAWRVVKAVVNHYCGVFYEIMFAPSVCETLVVGLISVAIWEPASLPFICGFYVALLAVMSFIVTASAAWCGLINFQPSSMQDAICGTYSVC